MIGEVKISSLSHVEVARVSGLIDRKNDVGVARLSAP